ncbi:hypothetical protein BpHYR1_005640 [Brachionus plicatilis]|uniref:Uncharacterized protein n=1 Tax=Brachionus plicatilis TaxID=10195 RepID=A0A3M7S071_BRAPC|nr:hypothetical protein BpHYR1_005640 [Brachionus plicatilis]
MFVYTLDKSCDHHPIWIKQGNDHKSIVFNSNENVTKAFSKIVLQNIGIKFVSADTFCRTIFGLRFNTLGNSFTQQAIHQSFVKIFTVNDNKFSVIL